MVFLTIGVFVHMFMYLCYIFLQSIHLSDLSYVANLFTLTRTKSGWVIGSVLTKSNFNSNTRKTSLYLVSCVIVFFIITQAPYVEDGNQYSAIKKKRKNIIDLYTISIISYRITKKIMDYFFGVLVH
ncbi:hypothetical protein ACJX0J_006958, partial [Zea mays]